MNDEIIAIYYLCDDILKAMNHQEDSQQKISDGKVMTTAIVATPYESGNFEKGRKAMSQPQYIPNMISRSRFNRRLHRVEPMLEEYQKLLEESEELDAIRAYDLAISDDDDEISFEVAIAEIENSQQWVTILLLKNVLLRL